MLKSRRTREDAQVPIEGSATQRGTALDPLEAWPGSAATRGEGGTTASLDRGSTRCPGYAKP